MSGRVASGSAWTRIAARFLPFADAATTELPLSRLLRLSLFQVSVGMTAVLLSGTLNRVMIVELGVPAALVAAMIALPLLVAPFRALIGHRSDHHRSVLGWRRVPYIWFGTLLQFGGLAIMPFALLLLSRPELFAAGAAGGCAAFLLAGAGMHMTQTAGLALATDLAPENARPRAVALLYVMLLAGMMIAAFVVGGLLADFAPTRLVQVVQGAGVLAVVLNITALWKQEARNRSLIKDTNPRPAFATVWADFTADRRVVRLLAAVGLGAAAFSMQDVLLEPYGGEILGLSVGATTSLTGLWAFGTLAGFAFAGMRLARGGEPHRLAGFGALAGVAAFMLVIFAAPFSAPWLLLLGALGIGLGGGLFMVGTLIAAMGHSKDGASGLALGAWGAVQASAAGLAILIGGLARDVIAGLAVSERLGATLASRATGYGAVYASEILLLLLTIAVLGPLVRAREEAPASPPRFGLSQFPS